MRSPTPKPLPTNVKTPASRACGSSGATPNTDGFIGWKVIGAPATTVAAPPASAHDSAEALAAPHIVANSPPAQYGTHTKYDRAAASAGSGATNEPVCVAELYPCGARALTTGLPSVVVPAS